MSAQPPYSEEQIYEVIADGDLPMLKALLKIIGPSKLLNMHTSQMGQHYGKTPLHYAAASGQLDCLELLLLSWPGLNVNCYDSTVTKVTPLHEAVRAGDIAICTRLIRAGALLDAVDASGDNVLHWAARETNATFTKNLLRVARQEGANKSYLVRCMTMTNHRQRTPAQVARSSIAADVLARLEKGEDIPGERKNKRKTVAMSVN